MIVGRIEALRPSRARHSTAYTPAMRARGVVVVAILTLASGCGGGGNVPGHPDTSRVSYQNGYQNGQALANQFLHHAQDCENANQVQALNQPEFDGPWWLQGCYDGVNSLFNGSLPSVAPLG